MRFLFGMLGAVFMAFALAFAVADIARSLADDVLRLTLLGQALAGIGVEPASPAGQTSPMIDIVAMVSTLSASAALGAVAFLLLFLARPRLPARRRTIR